MKNNNFLEIKISQKMHLILSFFIWFLLFYLAIWVLMLVKHVMYQSLSISGHESWSLILFIIAIPLSYFAHKFLFTKSFDILKKDSKSNDYIVNLENKNTPAPIYMAVFFLFWHISAWMFNMIISFLLLPVQAIFSEGLSWIFLVAIFFLIYLIGFLWTLEIMPDTIKRLKNDKRHLSVFVLYLTFYLWVLFAPSF